MKSTPSSPCFARWAVTGVILPFVVILILTFVIVPAIWGHQIAASLGNELGLIFIVYLLGLTCIAAAWKIRHERKQRSQPASSEKPKEERGSR